MVTEIVGNSL